MTKLMSSLIAASMIGAFSLSAVAADKAPATMEKPAAAPHKAEHAKKDEKKIEHKADKAEKAAEPMKK
ncbi:hypothetical protein F8A86_03450 [Betaproteobacteria bacterium SCN1]|nr:hypothetical protein F8A86_03450 [Betaproteobacteria bacterium SCN1]MBN8761214.1 hypothetical protein [Thiobacillus sp.]ODU88480.1 MAG: hypothetical protein ABT21_11275 [Thiobacillus sp. SCN 65-179]OJW36435.1 MAG: hypothetical protein BGO61_01810 [Thiobacillus sp. 65-69]